MALSAPERGVWIVEISVHVHAPVPQAIRQRAWLAGKCERSLVHLLLIVTRVTF